MSEASCIPWNIIDWWQHHLCDCKLLFLLALYLCTKDCVKNACGVEWSGVEIRHSHTSFDAITVQNRTEHNITEQQYANVRLWADKRPQWLLLLIQLIVQWILYMRIGGDTSNGNEMISNFHQSCVEYVSWHRDAPPSV